MENRRLDTLVEGALLASFFVAVAVILIVVVAGGVGGV